MYYTTKIQSIGFFSPQVVIHYLGRKIPLALMFLSSFMFLLLSLAIDGDQNPYGMYFLKICNKKKIEFYLTK